MSSVQDKKIKVLNLVKKCKDTRSADELKECLQVVEETMPVPKSGELLVRVEYSPINPSDLSNLAGQYEASPNEFPKRVGFEASAVVVASGGGIAGMGMKGKRVAVSASGSGIWGEYAVVPALTCVTLPSNVSLQHGACTFVNPLTVVSFVEIAKSRKCRAILHTAAASSLGKMLVRYAYQNNLEVINVVRKEAQVETLKALGARYVVNTSEEDWVSQLRNFCAETQCTLGFDAVAGPQTGLILGAMPNKSEIQVYGGLSGQASSNVSPQDLIFRRKALSGFHLSKYLATKNLFQKKGLLNKVVANLEGTLATEIGKVFDMEDVAEAVQYHYATSQKVLLRMHKAPKAVVLGSSGYVGQSTLAALAALPEVASGALLVSAGVRDPEGDKSKSIKELANVSLVAADMGNEESCVAALQGATAVFIVVPGHENRTELAQTAIRAAAAAKVPFVLLLSVSTVPVPDKSLFGRQFAPLEEDLKKSEMDYCIVRLPMFVDNNMAHAGSVKNDGAFYAPAKPDAPFTPVCVGDVGAACATILANPSAHSGKEYDLVGPSITHEALAAELSKVAGKEVKYVQVPYPDAKQAMVAMGLPEWQVDGINELWSLIDAGEPSVNQSANGTLRHVLGRDPTSLQQWVEQNAAAFKAEA